MLDGVACTPGHAPDAMHAGDFLFTSGLLPLDAHGRVPQHFRHNADTPRFRRVVGEQTAHLLDTISALCEAIGGTLGQVCKVQAFMSDLAHLPALLSEWGRAFPMAPPAFSTVAMGDVPLLVPGAVAQWDVIAYAPRRLGG